MTKTLYWDDKEKQFVYIVWDGEFAKHHRLPKSVFTDRLAKAYIKKEKLDA